MHPTLESPLLQEVSDRRELVYESRKKEPLGTTLSRNYKLPEEIASNPDFKFGVTNVMSESAKNLIFPLESESELSETNATEQEQHAMYVRTHGDYDPGEQKTRGYDWNKTQVVDPTSHRFGLKNEFLPDGAKRSLNPVADAMATGGNNNNNNGGIFSTQIISKLQDDFNKTNKDELGKPKNLGFGDGTKRPETFGKANEYDEWGAMDCIRGGYSAADQKPDSNLGKSVKEGYRNEVRSAKDAERAFGTPTVRTDIRKPKEKSIANTKNYGGEPDAARVVFPSKYATIGVYEEDFTKPLPKQEIKELLELAGQMKDLDETDFDRIFDMAVQSGSNNKEEDKVSIQQFRLVWTQFELEKKLRM